MSFIVHLAKESFKFSSTHFTIFSETKAERLHGHNYQLTCEIELGEIDPKIGMAFDFNLIKPEIKALCDEVDERILIATKSPFLKLKYIGNSIEMQFSNRRYQFPKEDCKELELVNITSEELARHFCKRLWSRLNEINQQKSKANQFKSLQIKIEESLGQGVSFKITRDSLF